MILCYSKGIGEPIVEPQVPMTYDLSGDPQQIRNLTATKQDNVWMNLPVYREVARYEASVKRNPNIKARRGLQRTQGIAAADIP